MFLGDMDPVDLLVYAWLRASLRPRQVVHLGINDAFLSRLRTTSTEAVSVPCVPAERNSLDLLKQVFPDVGATIGPKCIALLERGEKLELDGMLGGGDVAEALRSRGRPRKDAPNN
jgi:hypothetical protein